MIEVAENLADVIETYLKTLINTMTSEEVELSRRELATRFRCAPSQISYVLSTRFTPVHGYIVETKRGGGGFIKIFKTGWQSEKDIFQGICQGISEAEADSFLSKMYHSKIMDKSDVYIARNILKVSVLDIGDERERKIIRAKITEALVSYILHKGSEKNVMSEL